VQTVEESERTVYTAKCDACDTHFSTRLSRRMAESDASRHECGVHREVMQSGEYRWWCDDFLRVCICGASYGSQTLTPFECPKSVPLREKAGTE